MYQQNHRATSETTVACVHTFTALMMFDISAIPTVQLPRLKAKFQDWLSLRLSFRDLAQAKIVPVLAREELFFDS